MVEASGGLFSIEIIQLRPCLPSMANLSESAKIRGSITFREFEEDHDMAAGVLLPSMPLAESSVVLPSTPQSSANTTPVDLIEGLVESYAEGRISRSKVAEQ